MMKYALLAASTLALVACGQQATTVETAETPAQDIGIETAAMTNAQFAQAVANADAFEVQSSELAASRAARQDVKAYAAMMVRDHGATTQELATLAPTLGIQAPTPQLDTTHQDRLNNLTSLNGEAFDDAYLDAQVEAHENAVSLFERFTTEGEAGPLRDWASTTLTKLRTHLTSVQTLENATKQTGFGPPTRVGGPKAWNSRRIGPFS
jgi:putative membrane protein